MSIILEAMVKTVARKLTTLGWPEYGTSATAKGLTIITPSKFKAEFVEGEDGIATMVMTDTNNPHDYRLVFQPNEENCIVENYWVIQFCSFCSDRLAEG